MHQLEEKMRDDFIEFKQYYHQSAKQVPADSFYLHAINHKFRHSVEVLHNGQILLNQSPELKNQSKEFKHLAELALLFHDVGRFEEAVLQYKAPAQAFHYDHGLMGYELLKTNPKYQDMRILFAIRYHGKLIEEAWESPLWQELKNTPQSEDIKKILYLVRDADKLANFYRIKQNDYLRKDLFYKQLTQETLYAELSEKVKQQYLQKKPIALSDVYSFADRILLVLAMYFDLNYQLSKELFIKKGYDTYLLGLLAEYIKDKAEFAEIKAVFYQSTK